MSDMEEVGFPTQGELLQFMYKAAGVLPDKQDATPGFDEKRRKKLQKALERLAGEDGELEDSFGEMVADLAYLATGYLELAPLNLAAGDVLFDLLAVYGNVLQDEGSYLSKRDTLRWLIAERLTSAAAVFIARQISRFDLRQVPVHLVQVPNWYLPDFSAGEPVWPLAKVMRWVYSLAGLTPTQFHYPGRKADEADVIRKQDLENACNWLQGKHVPSAADLRRTFDRGFAACGLGAHGDTATRVDAARIALFLARAATYLTKALEEQFGRAFLQSVCATFESTLDFALEDTRRLDRLIDEMAHVQGLSARDPILRAHAVQIWDENLRIRLRRTSEELQAVLQRGAVAEPDIQRLVNAYGRLPVLPAVAALEAERSHDVPAGFREMLARGEELAHNAALTSEQVDAYESHLEQGGLTASLPWITPWLRFLVCYRREDDAHAWHWVSLAYEGARYRAGARQYPIVNHYIEMAAKVGKRVAFRRGVQWARYVGLSVRWIRNKELTPENLDFAMAVLKRARYIP